MTRRRIPAVFMRGGSSKGVFFHARDLPASRQECDAIFLQVIGSPDPYRRQLDGMGGGVSSVSKAVIVSPSARADADVDYNFAQVSIDKAHVDYSAICGNLSSAVGAFAVDEGLVKAQDGEAVVRVFNTNTNKLYHARFPVSGGQVVEEGDFVIPGVTGGGAKVTLDYIEPGGAATGRLLPTGNVRDELDVPGVGKVEVSMIDATAGTVYVDAARFGLTAGEHPDTLDAMTDVMGQLEAVRRAAAVVMGISPSADATPPSAPRIAIVGPPQRFTAIDGSGFDADSHDLSARIVSLQVCHKALTLSGAMCTGVAARIEGTIPNAFSQAGDGPVRLGNPSGVLPVDADVARDESGAWHARSATSYRTQRRLMEGFVVLPESRLARAQAAE